MATDKVLVRRARIVFCMSIAAFVVGFVLAYLNRNTHLPASWETPTDSLTAQLFSIAMSSFSFVGVLVATRQPHNRIAWILLAIGALWAASSVSENYVVYGALTNPGSVPGVVAVVASGSGGWVAPILLMGVYLILLFPDGKVPSRRWRWVPWTAAICGVLVMVSITFFPGSLEDSGFKGVQNPLGIGALEPVLEVMQISLIGIPLCVVASAAALIGRFRRSRGVERLQLKWFAAAGAVVALAFFVSIVTSLLISLSGTEAPAWLSVVDQITIFLFALIPIAAGVAILKYRLYDIDVVINKTIVFGLLAAFITAVYVAIVVGIGTLLGSQDEPNLALSIAATAIVAIAFSPVKERTQRLANRLVYGQRWSPYEVLSELSRAVATAGSPKEVLRAVARSAAQGVGSESATVSLVLNGDSLITVAYPEESSSNGARVERVTVMYESERLGELAVHKGGAGDPITPQDRKLLDDLSSQAGLGLHNARLAFELQARLEEISKQADELQDSRSRIVSAADDSRRRLERDIAEGPRRELVEIEKEVKSVHAVMATDAPRAAQLLEHITKRTNETLDTLRELARGIYPPILADKGVAAALESHIRKRELDVTVIADDDGRAERFEEGIETTVYFCCIEALSAERAAEISLARSEGELVVTIEGADIEPSTYVTIRDRVEASEGRVENANGRLRFSVPAPAGGAGQPLASVQASSSSSGPN
jgi:signal transduction histidine kinase